MVLLIRQTNKINQTPQEEVKIRVKVNCLRIQNYKIEKLMFVA